MLDATANDTNTRPDAGEALPPGAAGLGRGLTFAMAAAAGFAVANIY